MLYAELKLEAVRDLLDEKQWEPMLADAQKPCALEPTFPTHYVYCAFALKQLGRTKELQEVCEKGLKLDMPDVVRKQLIGLKEE